MTSLLFSEDHLAFAESIRRMAEREFLPTYLERATRDEFPSEAHKTLAKHGVLALGVPEEFGGQGADLISLGVATEELARCDFNLSLFVLYTASAGTLSALPPDEARDLGPRIASGESIWCGAITEPDAGSDTANVKLRARKVSGGWALSGEKTSVTLGAYAHKATVLAQTDPSLGRKGLASFLVDLDDTVERQVFRDAGFRPLGRAALAFSDTFVPDTRMLVETGRGQASTLALFEFARVMLCLMCIGCAQRAIEITADHVRNREAFGQPISRYQGVSFTLAEHETHLEAARLLAYKALSLQEAGRSSARESSMCKWFAPQSAVRAINDCIVLHGHIAYSEEMPLQQMLRDVSGNQIADGTPQIQKLVVARHLLGREWV
jgi:cyclohexanecarboxyl-CoA dehydrogenase